MIDYNQGDKSWGDIPYPKKPYTLSTSGCGPTTVANLVRYITGKKVTPKDTGIYMRQHGYAIAGQGTLWAGMPLTLNHYGLVDKEYSTVIGSFDAFKKHKTGYILFRKGTKGGITWTTNGHYVAIEDYKEEKGKHYFYTCDSGNRDNDGWHCYETQMYGLVKQIHVVYKNSTKPKKSTETPKKPIKKGFDISYAQNGLTKTSFNKAKAAGWEFCIIRIGTILKGKLYTDKEFESKYKNAKEAGLIVGAYWYGMATDTTTAKKEAEYCIEQLKGKTLDYPVFYDFEDKCQSNLGKKKSKQIIDTFCKTIEKAGYKAGVYASYSWLNDKIDPIEDYYVWLAQYPKATYKGRYEMHQYSSVGKVEGIGNIDVDTSEIPIIKTVEKTVPEKAAEWAIKTAKDNSFAYGKGGPKDWYHGRCRARQVGCYYCGTTVSGPKKAKKGSKWEKTYCCNSFVMAAYVHGGGLFSKCKNGSTKIDYWLNLKKDGKTLFELSKNPTVKTLKVGDILCNGKHVKLYVGNGKVAHAKRQGWDSGSITVETIKKIGDYEVARYKGPTTI